jgi:hypothetical protein
MEMERHSPLNKMSIRVSSNVYDENAGAGQQLALSVRGDIEFPPTLKNT